MKTVSVIIIMLLFGFGQSANAQVVNDKKIIGVDEAIAIALKNNNELKAKSLEVSAAQSLKGTANELPKLDLNAQLGQYNSVKFDNAFQLEQTIPFPTLFGAKKSLINAQTQSKQIQQLVTTNDLKNRVRSYYYQLVYLTYNKVKLQYLDTLYIDFVKTAALRFKTGETKKLELSTAETKQGEIKLLLQQNEIYLINAYQNLKGLMNVKEDFGIENPKRYEPLKVSTFLDSATISNHPTIKLWYQEALVAEQQIKVEKASALPDFKLGYNNQSLIGFQMVNGQEQYFNGSKRFNAVNMGLAIPIGFGANKARVQSLNYQKQAAQANAQYQQQQLTAQFNNAVQQYQQHLQEHNYYVQKALPNAKEIVQVAKLGYRTGDINYVEYLYALKTATDIELKYLEVIQQVNQSVVLINYLINQ